MINDVAKNNRWEVILSLFQSFGNSFAAMKHIYRFLDNNMRSFVGIEKKEDFDSRHAVCMLIIISNYYH